MLDLARQYAVANNTYTWAVFASDPSSKTGALYSVIIGSKDGTSTSDGFTAIDLDVVGTYDLKSPTSNLMILQKAETYRGAEIGTLSQSPAPSGASAMAPNANVSFTFPNSSIAIAYLNANPKAQRIVQFDPNGQSYISGSMSQAIELGLLAMKGSVPDPNNVAAIEVDGFTGQTRVYRN